MLSIIIERKLLYIVYVQIFAGCHFQGFHGQLVIQNFIGKTLACIDWRAGYT